MADFEPDWCVHPGELVREYREHIRISPHDLAGETGLTVGELYDLEECRSDIDPLLASQLAQVFGTTQQFWINLQENYDKDFKRIHNIQ